MPYELGITEVGPAEYPLLEVLRETIFSEVGHRSLSTFEELLDGRKDVLMLIAHLEGNPVGFKIGCQDRPGIYHSRSGGILKDYRRLGLARRMQDWQHSFCRARGYRQVWFNTFNHFPGMMRFGLTSGFRPMGCESRGPNELSFKFSLDLNTPAPSPDLGDDTATRAFSGEIENIDAAAMLLALDHGWNMAGVRCDLATGQTFIRFEKAFEAR